MAFWLGLAALGAVLALGAWGAGVWVRSVTPPESADRPEDGSQDEPEDRPGGGPEPAVMRGPWPVRLAALGGAVLLALLATGGHELRRAWVAEAVAVESHEAVAGELDGAQRRIGQLEAQRRWLMRALATSETRLRLSERPWRAPVETVAAAPPPGSAPALTPALDAPSAPDAQTDEPRPRVKARRIRRASAAAQPAPAMPQTLAQALAQISWPWN